MDPGPENNTLASTDSVVSSSEQCDASNGDQSKKEVTTENASTGVAVNASMQVSCSDLTEKKSSESIGAEQNDHKIAQQPSTSNGEQAEVGEKRPLEEEDDVIDIKALVDMYEEEEEEEEMAKNVLGGADENQCSSMLMDKHRQPLYACNTCEMNVDEKTGKKYHAGICLACSYHCHDGHELFELYSKRNFNCDCGNSRFRDTKCKLFHKIGFHDTNKYNDNFAGLYCICKRPYPDPECQGLEEMYQCAICEDWFHLEHLNASSPPRGHADMICYNCVGKNNFLVYYKEDGLFEFSPVNSDEELEKVSKTYCESFEAYQVVEEDRCRLEEVKQRYAEKHGGEEVASIKCQTLFLGYEWRLALCKCAKCLAMYKHLDVAFLLDPRDMVVFYSHTNREKADQKEDSSLKKVSYVQQVELLQGYKLLKDEFTNFLQSKGFANSKAVIKLEDITEFTEKLKNKRPRNNLVQYTCR